MSLLSLRFFVYVTLSVTSYVTAQNDCDSSVLCDGPQLIMEFEDPHPGAGRATSHLHVARGRAGMVKGERYMLVGIDPDAPSCEDPTRKWVRHMLVGDLNADDLASGSTDNGYVATPYRGPNPPAGSGFHRYQWLVYVQPLPMDEMVDVPAIDDPAASWNVEEFLINNGIEPESYLASMQYRSSRD